MDKETSQKRKERAEAIAMTGNFETACKNGSLPSHADITVSEALILGLVRQNVRSFFTVFGHGSTELGEVLRVYEEAGVVKSYGVRSEIEASHAATALRWVTGKKAAVVTSIGPGALQAMSASIAASSNSLGVWYIYGDETTEDEGPNMQQIPRYEQGLYLRLCETMGHAYCLHTPRSIFTALRRGINIVDNPYQGGPFYLLLPMNIQPVKISNFSLLALPDTVPTEIGGCQDELLYQQALEAILSSVRPVVKIGGGGKKASIALEKFLELSGAVAVTTPHVTGVLPYSHPANMTVGGSKGSLCGNYAMENADLLVAIGTRFVCQSDSSRTGYPEVKKVVNINIDYNAALHYNHTIPLVGDACKTLERLNEMLMTRVKEPAITREWRNQCSLQKKQWKEYKEERYRQETLEAPIWKGKVLTQPASIKAISDFAHKNNAVLFFDAGDVQANGFQIVEDDRQGQTFTETGASYMGFAACALLATGVAEPNFYGIAVSGDGSFTMNPQILIDGVQHKAKGCIVILDNRRMAAISGLQKAQYGKDYATHDSVCVDYVAWAKAITGILALDGGRSVESLKQALKKARSYDGLSLIHVPVYYGDHPLGELGAFGRWNVGCWVEDTQNLRHKIGL